MSYVGNEEVELRLGTARYVELTDDAGSGSANEAVADEARLGAEGELNSYLARRYAVPVDLSVHSQVAGVLKSAVLDLVEYRLHARRRQVPVDVIGKRDAALQWLRRVAVGDVSLPSLTPIGANASLGVRASVSGAERTLSREELGEF